VTDRRAWEPCLRARAIMSCPHDRIVVFIDPQSDAAYLGEVRDDEKVTTCAVCDCTGWAHDQAVQR
jgi:hypothetical protein